MLDWLACTVVKLLSAGLCLARPEVAVWLGERFGLLAAWLQPKRVRIGLANLRAAFDGTLMPEQAGRVLRACYRQLGAGMVELLRLPVIDRAYVDRYVTIEGRDRLEQAVASGRPVILLTGHYGNWELSSIVAALRGYPIVALARAQQKFPRLYRLLVSYRESKGCTIIHKGGAMRRLIGALERRQLIGIVADQASRQGILVEFFARPALFATGPFELARSKHALILPVFIHRVRGPYHRVVIEPSIMLDHRAAPEHAVRQGIEAFAAVLSRHVLDDPSQWLWMHKRWKHTPARRALILSDGKAGHLKQSLAVIESLKERRAALSSEVIEIRYRHRLARGLAFLWSWWVVGSVGGSWCLRWALTRESAAALLSRYADLIISCGSSSAPANLLWSAASGAKSVVIMNPAPLPLRRFSLVIAPRHDRLPGGRNVVRIDGALVGWMPEDTLAQAQGRLRAHPKFRAEPEGAPAGREAVPAHPVIAVFLGGDTPDYELNEITAETLIAQLRSACETLDGWCLVTTSRRTAPSVERLVAERLGRDPRCRLALIASRDPIDGTMEGMLGSADVAVVTVESISMISEACASGRRVVVVEAVRWGGRTARMTKHERFLRGLARGGYVRIVAAPQLSRAIQQALNEDGMPKRLDNLSAVSAALSTLL